MNRGPAAAPAAPAPPVLRNTTPVQSLGKQIVGLLYVALRSAQIYDENNETVTKQLEKLHHALVDLLHVEGAVNLALSRNFFFLNGARVKVDLKVYITYHQLLKVLRSLQVGRIEIQPGLELPELRSLVFLLANTEVNTE